MGGWINKSTFIAAACPDKRVNIWLEVPLNHDASRAVPAAGTAAGTVTAAGINGREQEAGTAIRCMNQRQVQQQGAATAFSIPPRPEKGEDA